MKFVRKSLFVAIASFCALGLLVAQGAAKQREFQGTITIQVGLKQADGSWKIIDEVTSSSLNFTSSVVDLASGKKVTTPFVWTGQSRDGHKISIKLQGSGDGQVDLASGKLDLQMPFQFTVDGKTSSSVFKLTTDSASGPLGNLTGQRAVIDKVAKTANLRLVSANLISLPGVTIIDEAISPGEKQARKITLSTEQLALAITANGKLIAK